MWQLVVVMVTASFCSHMTAHSAIVIWHDMTITLWRVANKKWNRRMKMEHSVVDIESSQCEQSRDAKPNFYCFMIFYCFIYLFVYLFVFLVLVDISISFCLLRYDRCVPFFLRYNIV